MSNYKILHDYDNNLKMTQDIMGSGTTNNVQIEKLCHQLFGDLFIGCLSSDQFPKYIKRGQMFILNNKSSRSKGEHFVAFIKDNDGKLYGYDSFDRSVHDLSPWWKKKHIINANREREQSFNEKNCGSRCIAFLITFRKWGRSVIDAI